MRPLSSRGGGGPLKKELYFFAASQSEYNLRIGQDFLDIIFQLHFARRVSVQPSNEETMGPVVIYMIAPTALKTIDIVKIVILHDMFIS